MTDTFIRPGEAASCEPLPYVGCGLDGIYLCNGYERETRGGNEFLRIKDREGLHRAIARHLVETRKTLTGKEVRFIRVQMNRTQRELAEDLGTTSQSVARWEKDQSAISGAADRLLRITFMVSLLTPEELKRLVTSLSDQIEKMGELGNRPAVFNRHDHHWSEQLKEAA